MLTKIQTVTEKTVVVSSADGNVTVTVQRDDDGHPAGPLTRQEAHDVLVDVEDVTNEFLAAVEADVHATCPNWPTQSNGLDSQ